MLLKEGLTNTLRMQRRVWCNHAIVYHIRAPAVSPAYCNKITLSSFPDRIRLTISSVGPWAYISDYYSLRIIMWIIWICHSDEWSNIHKMNECCKRMHATTKSSKYASRSIMKQNSCWLNQRVQLTKLTTSEVHSNFKEKHNQQYCSLLSCVNLHL